MRWWRELEWAQPAFLWAALVALPVFWWAHRAAGRVTFSSLRLLPARAATWRTRLAWTPDALLALAIVTLAVAAAGPRIGEQDARIRRDAYLAEGYELFVEDQ